MTRFVMTRCVSDNVDGSFDVVVDDNGVVQVRAGTAAAPKNLPQYAYDASGNITGLVGNPLLPDSGASIRQALGIVKSQRTGDSVPVWKGSTAYAVGDRIFPTAYLTAATYTTGFVSVGGALYCLICITAGTSAATEPSWKDPASITSFGYKNGGTGAGLLDITDGGVTWRIRPAIFIDPVNGNNTGATRGTQVNPYLDWAVVCGTGTAANPWSATIGCVYNDDLVDSTGEHQVFAGSCFLQRAGTTATSASAAVLTIRGPNTDTGPDYYNGAADTVDYRSPRRLTFGCYRQPRDTDTKAYLTRTGAYSTTTAYVVTATNRRRYELLDFDVSNAVTGDLQFGLLLYHPAAGSEFGQTRVHLAGLRVHDCVGGTGLCISQYGDSSSSNPVNGVLVEDSDFYNNTGHGAFVSGLYGTLSNGVSSPYSVKYARCRAWNNGQAAALTSYHHGFSSIAHRVSYGDGYTTGASGWTNTSGTIYSRTPTPLAGQVTTIDDVPAVTFRSNGGIYPGILKRNTATPTAPAAGEYGYTASVLYINVGVALASIPQIQINVQIAQCANIQYVNCESFSNNAYLLAGVLVEGFGFAADEFSSVSFQSCYAHHNKQSGFFFHYGTDSSMRGCYSAYNHSSGVYQSCTQNVVVEDNTILMNGKAAGDSTLNFGLPLSYASNPSIGVQSYYAATNTQIRDNLILGHDWAMAKYSDPTTPINNTAFALKSTLVGGGNTYAVYTGANGLVSGPQGALTGSPLVIAATTTLSGDTTVR